MSELDTGPLGAGRIENRELDQEVRTSFLDYAMSVIVSRALPDVRDGLKPSQRRILVAMNDLNLGPTAGRTKCAKICGDTSGNYHPHGEAVIYPTLVHMAQPWAMRLPQSPQNQPKRRFPASELHSKLRGSPLVNPNAASKTVSGVEKAPPPIV